MLKELEEKIIVERSHLEDKIFAVDCEKEINGRKIKFKMQNIIPASDLEDVYIRSLSLHVKEPNYPLGYIINKVLIDLYTNIDVANLSLTDISQIIYCMPTCEFYDVVYDRINNFDMRAEFEVVVEDLIDKYLNDKTLHKSFDEIKQDLESLDPQKIKDLVKLFVETNTVKGLTD